MAGRRQYENLRKLLLSVLILLVLYGALLLVERLTTQELVRVSHLPSHETVCLMWKPRLLKGDGICYLDLMNSEGKVVSTVKLGILDAAFNALQQFGQLGFVGQEITVSSLQTGEVVQRFVVRDGHLSFPE